MNQTPVYTTSGKPATRMPQSTRNVEVRVFGLHDTSAQLLRARVELALDVAALRGRVVEVVEPGVIQSNGIRTLPALMVGNVVLSEGIVPSVEEIAELLKHPDLKKSKLFRLRKIGVPVDMSEVSANALRYAWHIARHVGANVEVVFAMDSIFEGSLPAATGFLTGYQTTMRAELDSFIAATLREDGYDYEPPVYVPGTPDTHKKSGQDVPSIHSRVIYGAPDLALASYSDETDLMVMGTTGHGNIAKKLFGSVSLEVSKNSHAPAIFIPPDAEFRGLQNVLYASDFDSLHTLAVEQAVSFAKRFDGQIHFVHVGPGGEKGMEAQRKAFESDYGASNPDRPFIFHKMVSEDITGALQEYAFYHRIDLLVFVTHRRNFWETILHKSITNAALLSSNLPVLVIHSDNDKA